MRRILTFTLFTFILSVLLTEYSQAIPAFARKYRLSCKTCHSPASPTLKGYGDDFAGAGFKLEEYDAPGYYVDAGDEKLSLIRNFPLAVRLDGFVTYNMGSDGRSDFGSPYLMKLLSGGSLSENLSYYFYFYLSERGEVVGVEDAFLMYDNLFNSELDIILGQFQVSDPLFKRELRLQLEDYRLYTSQIGNSRITLTYDKGVMLSYGFETGTDLVAEVVNGNGLVEADPFHVFDHDKYKGYLGRISQNIGEYFRVGAFGYTGKERLENNFNDAVINEVQIWGPDFSLNVNDKYVLNFQYTMRNDSEVFPASNSLNSMEDLSTQGMLAEAIYAPQGDQSDWYLLGMYNWVDSDFDPADYESLTFHAGYLLRRNVRLVGEYTRVMTGPADDGEYGQFSLGFVSAY